jgi:UDP-N-acetyl-2-amino-2-deoxyglucuronate dehydrogenase
MKNFALIGYSGYIAPRHINAIKSLECNLLSCFDLVASNNVKESFPASKHFSDYEEFKSYISDSNNSSKSYIEFVAVCSPNHLHFDHIIDMLNLGCNVICEKPLVGDITQLQLLKVAEAKSKKKVYCILQLRYHDAVYNLKNYLSNESKFQEIDLIYIAGRDKDYLETWKGNINKSFGIGANIGIHLFDMLYYVFGEYTEHKLTYYDPHKASGLISFKNARANWFLSIDLEDLPKNHSANTYRNIKVNDYEVDFSKRETFDDLHTISYREILNENGFGIEESTYSLNIALSINEKNFDKKNFKHRHKLLK